MSSDGNNIIVTELTGWFSRGEAWVYYRKDNNWIESNINLHGDNGMGDELQGHSVAISSDGSTVILGGLSDKGIGAAWIFAPQYPPIIETNIASCRTDYTKFKVTNIDSSTIKEINWTYKLNETEVVFSNQFNSICKFDISGEYLIKAKIVSKNDSIYTLEKKISILYDSLPILELGEEKEFCLSQTALIKPNKQFLYYEWSDGSKDSILAVNKTGLYSLKVSNKCNSQTDSIFIQFISHENLFIPNIITPNNDNLNETFNIDNHLLGNKLKIVNRWGDIVYSNDFYDNSWNGDGLSDGVYFYDISNTCFNKNFKGWIQIAK